MAAGDDMYTREETCCFTGHRPEKLPWGKNEQDTRCLALKKKICDAVEAAHAEGKRHFICGMARGCDFYFAEAVLALREIYPDVTLEAAIPCLTQTDGWPEEQKARYQRILAACDYETVVQEHYSRDCMQRRNRYMVDHAALLIAVHDGLPGGTRSTVLYAMRQKIMVVNLPI